MIKLHKLIATVFGIGYIGKGGGTIAAAVCCIILILIPASDNIYHWHFFITIFISWLGVWSGNVVEALWGKDSNKVVVDEVAGMMVTLLFIPVNIKHVVIGLILFRFFDIVKPLFIKKMELLPKGWGVMGDDILAGIYANVLLHVIVSYNIL
jgi:phosphatidylglycerophosphatase A